MADTDLDRRDADASFFARMRPGDWITIGILTVGGVITFNKMDARLARLEEMWVQQSATNGKLEASVERVHSDLRSDVKEVANTVRRLELQQLGIVSNKGKPG